LRGEIEIALTDIFAWIVASYERGELLARCAWCGRVRVDDDWVAPPLAALAAIDQANTVSHSICESCTQELALDPVGLPLGQPV
jgi:hypothetical protein